MLKDKVKKANFSTTDPHHTVIACSGSDRVGRVRVPVIGQHTVWRDRVPAANARGLEPEPKVSRLRRDSPTDGESRELAIAVIAPMETEYNEPGFHLLSNRI